MYILFNLVLKVFFIWLLVLVNVVIYKFKFSVIKFDYVWFNLVFCLRNIDNLIIINNDKYWFLSIFFCIVCFFLLLVKNECLGILMLRFCEVFIEESC